MLHSFIAQLHSWNANERLSSVFLELFEECEVSLLVTVVSNGKTASASFELLTCLNSNILLFLCPGVYIYSKRNHISADPVLSFRSFIFYCFVNDGIFFV